MNVIMAWKVIAGLFVLTSTSISVVSWLDKELLGIYENVYLYMIAEAKSDQGEDKDAPRSFECLLENATQDKKFYCEIDKLNNDEKTKQHLIFLGKNTSKKYKIKDLTTANNVFKVKFSGYKNIDTNKINKINVLKNNATFATLKTLIGSYKGNVVGKPTHLITQAKSETEQITHDNSQNNTCEWNNNNKHKCEIYNFSSQENVSDKKHFWDLLFQKPPTSGNTTIEKNKHYLVKLNDSVSLKDIKFPVIYEDNSDPKKKVTLEYRGFGVIDSNNDHLFAF